MATTVAAHGVDGLILATLLSGLILLAMGFLRLGAFIKFMPYPVTVGFSAGIATIIFASQIKDLFGLTLSVPEPGPLLAKLAALGAALATIRPASVAIAVATIGDDPARPALSAAFAGLSDRCHARFARRLCTCACRSTPSARISAASRAACPRLSFHRSR